jgi:hypothetical protein
LDAIVYPHHKLTRQRSVRALRQRLAGFTQMVFAQGQPGVGSLAWAAGGQGVWQRWLTNHTACFAPGVPTPALLQRMLATLNSYYGMYGHANTWRLRKHIYEVELGSLRQFFIPEGPGYRHLRIRKVWQQAPYTL